MYNRGSEKAWRFLADNDAVYKLGLAVCIVPAAEEVLVQQFRWQSDSAYLSDDVCKLPLVQMANMSKSPAASSINLLTRALLHDCSDGAYYQNFVNTFMNLHTGQYHWCIMFSVVGFSLQLDWVTWPFRAWLCVSSFFLVWCSDWQVNWDFGSYVVCCVQQTTTKKNNTNQLTSNNLYPISCGNLVVW